MRHDLVAALDQPGDAEHRAREPKQEIAAHPPRSQPVMELIGRGRDPRLNVYRLEVADRSRKVVVQEPEKQMLRGLVQPQHLVQEQRALVRRGHAAGPVLDGIGVCTLPATEEDRRGQIPAYLGTVQRDEAAAAAALPMEQLRQFAFAGPCLAEE